MRLVAVRSIAIVMQEEARPREDCQWAANGGAVCACTGAWGAWLKLLVAVTEKGDELEERVKSSDDDVEGRNKK